MSYFLNIETATTVCSVSVSEDSRILAIEEVNGGYTHAENLHVFMREMLRQAGVKANELNAVAISRGPGSYTGLRIGTSAAKGLAYALQIPLISVNTLEVMALAAKQKLNSPMNLVPMLDARRMEVYTAVYSMEAEEIAAVEALIIDEDSIKKFETYSPLCFFGDGMNKCKGILEKIKGSEFLEDVVPSAEFIAPLAYKKYIQNHFEDTAYFEPLYLKEFMSTAKKSKLD